ncbi:MAG: carbamoyl phosphate synthase large subunit, partial [Bacteroidales bacterium]|nr:carbamoyl phosphate synthase large subunit [Bacteroidales bacterium]
VGVKSSQFSFARLEEADPVLGVDMASTGEVGCIGEDFGEALVKSLLAVGNTVPKGNILLSTGDPLQKADMLRACRMLEERGCTMYATDGTYKYLMANGISCQRALWPSEAEAGEIKDCPSAIELIQDKKVDMVINILKDYTETQKSDGYRIRRAAVDFNIPLFTNARLATAFVRAFCTLEWDDLAIRSWEEY